MRAPSERLVERHAAGWRRATRHPFLDVIRDGSLLGQAFMNWLTHDYLFVRDLLTFQARLLGRAPRSAQATLVGGLVALEAELTWFESHAERRALALEVSRHPVTAAYDDLMIGLDRASYAAAIAALWALERAYLECWSSAAPGHPDYREFVEHWTTPEFAEYVARLGAAVDAALDSSSPDALKETEEAFLAVTELEHDFWEMA